MANVDERRSQRSNVVRIASLQCEAGQLAVRVSNISAHGALVGVGQPLEPDTEVEFTCNGHTSSGWVAWCRDGQAGIQFCEPVDPQRWRQSPGPAHQLVTRDMRNVDPRRPGFRGNQLTKEQRIAIEEWLGPRQAARQA